MELVPLEEILNRVSNVYEAVIIAAREARRINERRLVEQEHQLDEEEEAEEVQQGEEKEFFIAEEEKVTVQALKKLVEGKVRYSYNNNKDLSGG